LYLFVGARHCLALFQDARLWMAGDAWVAPFQDARLRMAGDACVAPTKQPQRE
jgi:hypothetical protein